MHCQICGSKASKNYGDAHLIICEKCYEIEDTAYLKELREESKKKSKKGKESSRKSLSDSEYVDYQKKSIKRGLSFIFIILIIPFSIFLITKIFSGIGWIGTKAGEKTIEYLGENKGFRKTIKNQSRNLGVNKEADQILDDFENAAKNLKNTKRIESLWSRVFNKRSFYQWCLDKGFITRSDWFYYTSDLKLKEYNEKPPVHLEKYLELYFNRNDKTNK